MEIPDILELIFCVILIVYAYRIYDLIKSITRWLGRKISNNSESNCETNSTSKECDLKEKLKDLSHKFDVITNIIASKERMTCEERDLLDCIERFRYVIEDIVEHNLQTYPEDYIKEIECYKKTLELIEKTEERKHL